MWLLLERCVRLGELTRLVQVLASQPDHLGSNTGTDEVKGVMNKCNTKVGRHVECDSRNWHKSNFRSRVK